MTRLLTFICLFALLTISSASFAEDNVVRGQIGKPNNKIKIYTDEQLEEALTISDECKAYDRTNVRYDCDCVGMQFLELRRVQGEKGSRYWMREAARRKCPNGPAMAGKIYTECAQRAPSKRGEDYDAFCKCYGSSFAKLFVKNPTDNLIAIEAQTVTAMKSCNVNAVSVREQERAAFVSKLKEAGVYDKLLPGAVDDEIRNAPPMNPKPQN